MAQPNVYMFANSAASDGEANATWELLGGSDKIVWCGVGGSAGMADTAIPNKQRPISGTEAVDEMWVGSTTSYTQIPLYGATGAPPDTPKGNVQVMMVTWDDPIATNPRITCYDATARTAVSNILAGTAGDTSSTSYIKARWSKATNTTWCDATTGIAGAKIIDGSQNVADIGGYDNIGGLSQSLQGDTQYLENDLDTQAESTTAYPGDVAGIHCFSNDESTSTYVGSDLEAIFTHANNTGILGDGRYSVFDILCWTGANLPPGTYNDKLSFRYTWT